MCVSWQYVGREDLLVGCENADTGGALFKCALNERCLKCATEYHHSGGARLPQKAYFARTRDPNLETSLLNRRQYLTADFSEVEFETEAGKTSMGCARCTVSFDCFLCKTGDSIFHLV